MTKLGHWIVFATLVALGACGGGPEQATLEQFFRAAQTNDTATLAYMSAVGPPLQVEAWNVVEVTSRSTEPFTLPEVLERFAVAEKERNAAQEIRQKYASDQKDALEQVIPKMRDDPEYKFRGKLGEVQAEWTKLLDERKEKESVFLELKQTLNQERGLAEKSVMRQVELGNLRGDIEVTEMLLNLKPKDGAELPFKVTLRKYALSEPESDRVEAARWVISDIEGATEEARAAADAARKAARAPKSADAAETSKAAEEQAESGQAARKEPARELRGSARVQILAPETKAEGDEAVTTIRVRNASKDWIVGLMVTEHWYDKQGNAVGSSSRTHRERFMPGEVLEMKLRTRKSPNFYQNQFEFSHANGDVKATVVESFPSPT